MPRRTNAFQIVTRVIHEALADEAATVTESHMVVDEGTGEEREVDITIQTEQKGVPLTIGIECRDGGTAEEPRPEDVTFVDEIRGKHEFMPIDVTVLVSSTGFTAGAKKKAEHLGMLALEPEELTEERARNLLHAGVDLYLCQTAYLVERVFLVVDECECHESTESTRVPIKARAPLFFADGKRYGTFAHYLRELYRHVAEPERFFLGESPHAMGFESVGAPRVPGSPVEPLYVKRDRKPHKVNEVRLLATSTEKSVPITLRYAILKEFFYGIGDFIVEGEEVNVVVTKKEGQDSRLTLNYNRIPKRKKPKP